MCSCRQLDARAIEPLALVAVGLVRDRRAQHPERDLRPVDVGFEARLELCDLLALLARQLAEVALRGEAPQLADAPVAVCHLAERLCLLEVGQLGMALVDRREVERVLEPRVVEVVLLVELGDEAVGLLAEAVQVDGGGRRHGP